MENFAYRAYPAHSPPGISAPCSVQDNAEDGEGCADSGEPGPPATPGNLVPTPIYVISYYYELHSNFNKSIITLQCTPPVQASFLLLTHHVSSSAPWSYFENIS